MDVSMAFLRGKKFEELIKYAGGHQKRSLQFDLPVGSAAVLRTIEGYEDFSEIIETLNMVTPAFGTNDAPWAWSIDFDEGLVLYGLFATSGDRKLYLLFRNGKLVLACSVHVDDLKGTSSLEERDRLYKFLVARYEDVTLNEAPFECIGLMHTRENDSWVLDQHHYVKQLNVIDCTGVKHEDPNVSVSKVYISAYQSLLGGMAWLTLTRPDIIVFVGRFQRTGSAPCVKDLLDINTVLRWIKRKPCKIKYPRLVAPLCLVCIADSAYKADDEDCLALRGNICAVIELRSDRPGGNMHVLDFYGRKQTRVNRGTFGAELNNTLEASECGMFIGGILLEIVEGQKTAAEIHISIHTGLNPLGLHLVGDAQAVFDAVTAAEIKVPNERSLLYAVRAVRDRLESRSIRRMHRCDTRDMLADALTKGSISRDEILVAFAKGYWIMKVIEQINSWSPTFRGT